MRVARYVFTLLAGAAILFPAGPASAQNGIEGVKIALEPKLASGGERIKGTVAVARARGVTPQDVTILLESDSPSLVQFRTTSLVIPANQTQAVFDFNTSATQVQTHAKIRAVLAPSRAMQADADLTLVPALINRVTLSAPSMIGTIGSSIQATAELKAPAPAGGIQLYLSSVAVSPSSPSKTAPPPLSNPFVPAGSRTVAFPLQYRDVLRGFSDADMRSSDFSTEFESQQRTITIFLGLDPYLTKTPTASPNRSLPMSFQLIPLRVNSVSVQPSAIGAGGEALGTFVLSASPGSGERFGSYTGNSSASRIVPVGTSCLQTSQLDFVLTPGSTTQNFKVCGRTVSAATQTTANVTLRSGNYTAPFTVQP